MADKYILGVDVGGTKIISALARLKDNAYEELASDQFATGAHAGGAEVLERLVQKTKSLLATYGVSLKELSSVAVGVPGVVHPTTMTTTATENIPGWDELEVQKTLSAALGAKVVLDNDVNLAALAELKNGAGQGLRHFILIAVGTGIGCGVVIDGKVHHGFQGFAGEIGEMLIPSPDDGRRLTDLESVVSGSALNRRLPAGITVEEAFKHYLKALGPGKAVIATILQQLKIAVFNSTVLLAPEAVILSGGFILKNPWIKDEVQAFLEGTCRFTPQVCLAHHGERAAVVGALELALAHS